MEIPKYIKATVRPSRETIIYVDILPSELRRLADRLEEGGIFNETISLSGTMNKERFEIRFTRCAIRANKE